MNLQRWITQHPSVFVLFFPIYFLCVWLLVCAVVSLLGGWFSLAKLYRTQAPFDGVKWRMRSGRMRWLMNYNNVLTFGVNPQGLYLANMFLFRFMQPPLLIPWSEIRVRREKGWIFEYVTLALGSELAIRLRITATFAAKLREAAGSHWPIEEM